MDPTLTIIALTVGFMALAIGLSVAATRARSNEFKRLAGELGLHYREPYSDMWLRGRKETRPVDPAELQLWTDEECLRRFSLGSQSGHCVRVAEGVRSGRQVRLLDFEYRSGKTTITTTVAVVHPTSAPAFGWRLRPEGLWGKVATAMGGQDIDLPGFPKFSGMFRLRSDSPSQVETLFGQKLTSFFEEHPGLCAESTPDAILLFHWKRRLSAGKARELLLSAERLAGLLEDGARPGFERPAQWTGR